MSPRGEDTLHQEEWIPVLKRPSTFLKVPSASNQLITKRENTKPETEGEKERENASTLLCHYPARARTHTWEFSRNQDRSGVGSEGRK